MTHILPPLEYGFDALEPHIDRRTMEIHYGTHHAAYVKNLNAALAQHPDLQSRPLDELLRNVHTLPSDIRTAVRNNGGGHANLSLFWVIMGPDGGGSPTGPVADAIDESFDGFDRFRAALSKVALEHFGSGWAWVLRQNDRLVVDSTPNQDSPLMEGETPILGIDVWEHAYYLKHQSKRADYIEAWWHVVNWAAVNRLFEGETAALATGTSQRAGSGR
jgi:Fe-Mn family superoxide dismutase